jgi:hypothetical protein
MAVNDIVIRAITNQAITIRCKNCQNCSEILPAKVTKTSITMVPFAQIDVHFGNHE